MPTQRREISVIDSSEIKLQWHVGYWDGAMSGVCTWQDNDYWFNMVEEIWVDAIDEDDGSTYQMDMRVFALYDIGPDNMAEEYRKHGLFRYMVGHHTDHGDRRGPTCHGRMNRGDWHSFYERGDVKIERDDYENWPLVGFFTG